MFDLEHPDYSKDQKGNLPISEVFDRGIEFLSLVKEFAHHTGKFMEKDAEDRGWDLSETARHSCHEIHSHSCEYHLILPKRSNGLLICTSGMKVA